MKKTILLISTAILLIMTGCKSQKDNNLPRIAIAGIAIESSTIDMVNPLLTLEGLKAVYQMNSIV